MDSRPLHIYRASAGSGKTFLLTSQYLRLLFMHPFKYREILAVTFTNKASEEMKERILGELEQLSAGAETPQAALLRQTYPRLQGDQLALEAGRIYRLILHDYARFSVGTIDSFVQQVIRAFAFEIGLDAGYQVELNNKAVKEGLADKLFALLDTNHTLRSWITDNAKERISSGRSWDFRNAMLELAEEIFKERFHLFETNMRKLDDPVAAFRELRSALQSQIRRFEEHLKTLGQKGMAAMQLAALETADFKYGKSGFAQYFNKIAAGGDFEPGSRVTGALGNINEWYAKSADAATQEKINALYPQLNALLEDAVLYYAENHRGWATARAVYQNLHDLNLLRVLADQLGDYRRENNVLLISDTHNLLRELVQDNEAPFLFEKTGNRYHHFLIDEFQDTSSFQWDNFKPLLGQSMASGEYNLLVGDVKQAIYRWRNGDWRLLLSEAKKQLGANRVQEGSLLENYRSHREIIAFNNHIFSLAPALLQTQFNNDMNAVASATILQHLQGNGYFSMIEDAYAESRQEIPVSAKEGGGLTLRFFERTNTRSSTSWREPVLGELAPTIETMIRDQGFEPGGIAILTRNNGDARTIIDGLLQYQQSSPDRTRYSIVSAEALLVSNSPAIQLLIAALTCLQDPDNQLARANLVQANAVRLQQSLSDPSLYKKGRESAAEKLPPAFAQQFNGLRWMALYECCETFIALFDLNNWTVEQAYLLHFRDLVNQFSRKGRSTLRDFLDWWEEEGKDKALPASGGLSALQVMTIHKSKGLAFDAVIIPYADWEFKNDRGKIWCRYDNENSAIKYVPVNLGSKLRDTDFAADYFEEQLFSYMDALNLLYVAFTRARKKILLYGPLPAGKTEASYKTVADLLYAILEKDSNYAAWWKENQLLLPVTPATTRAGTTEAGILEWPVQQQQAPPSWLRSETAASAWLITPSEQQALGSLLHLALSRISRQEELEDQIRLLQLEGALMPSLLPAFREKINAVLSEPHFKQWYGGAYEVLSEKDILLKGGSIRRPDKVFIGKEETILVDFKFTQEMSSSHGAQLEQYKSLLEQMGYKPVKAYLYYGSQGNLLPLEKLPRRQGNLFN